MQIVQYEEFENIELSYNENHTAIINGDYETEFNMIPFGYKHQSNNDIRRIVLMWTATIKLKEESILTFQIDDSYIINRTKGILNSKHFTEVLVKYSFLSVTEKYNSLSENHSVKLKDLYLFAKDEYLQNHYKLLFELLDTTWLD